MGVGGHFPPDSPTPAPVSVEEAADRLVAVDSLDSLAQQCRNAQNRDLRQQLLLGQGDRVGQDNACDRCILQPLGGRAA